VKLPGAAPFDPDAFVAAFVEPDPWGHVRAALRRDPWRKMKDQTALVAIVNGRGEVRIEDRADYAERLRRSDATVSFLIANERVPSGSVLVVRRGADGTREYEVVDLGKASG
jgi:hypothetical protein